MAARDRDAGGLPAFHQTAYSGSERGSFPVLVRNRERQNAPQRADGLGLKESPRPLVDEGQAAAWCEEWTVKMPHNTKFADSRLKKENAPAKCILRGSSGG